MIQLSSRKNYIKFRKEDQNMNKSRKCILFILGIIFISCAPVEKPIKEGPREQRYINETMDVIKVIYPGDESASIDSTTYQELYELKTNRRLLLRFDSYEAIAPRINLNQDDAVRMLVRVVENKSTPHRPGTYSIKVCALEKDWMLAANWISAHPFGDADWNGGSFSNGFCALPEKVDRWAYIWFNLTQVLRDLKNSGINHYGWILIYENNISSSYISIRGEKNQVGSEKDWTSPKLIWKL